MNFYSSGASLYKIMNLSEVVFHVRIVFDIFSIDCGVMYIRDGVCGGVIVAILSSGFMMMCFSKEVSKMESCLVSRISSSFIFCAFKISCLGESICRLKNGLMV